jgi:transcriptional regulator with XRE-family HTH domain
METIHPLDRLFERAKSFGVPMSRVCELAKVDATTPSRWKRGKTRPSADKLFALEVALDQLIKERIA